MPSYTYRCQDCGAPFEKILPISQYNSQQDCPECDSANTARTITDVNVVLKGDNWPGKMIKVKDQMARSRREAGWRQEEFKRDGRAPSLIPNVGGERLDSWSEAKSMAASKGLDISGHDKMIRKESELKSKIVKE
jgi:putative FmdB family regulatory protein